MQASGQREIYQGFGDTLALAFELALTPALFGGLGYLLDRWLGTLPGFTLGMFLLAVVGLFIRMWYGYDTRMRAHGAFDPAARAAPPAPLSGWPPEDLQA